jgi:putative oxidoreductase
MEIALWIAQALAAVMFVFHGTTLVFRMERARAQFPWAKDVSNVLLRFIGTAEILGAAGLILPALTRVLPWLTPLAAAGLVVLMILAALFHITRGEWPNVAFNVVLGAVAAFVAYGRSVVLPLT